MKVYHGERTREGCRVTVDGVPLRVCSDLSGAIAPFDWGSHGDFSIPQPIPNPT